MNIDIFQEGDKDHQDSIWYDGDIALLKEGDRIVMVIAAGEIRIMSQRGIVYDGKERCEGIDGGLKSDEDLKKIGHSYDDKYYWENNNWFELLYRRERTDQWEYILGDVHYQYDAAMEAAKELLKDEEFWKEVE